MEAKKDPKRTVKARPVKVFDPDGGAIKQAAVACVELTPCSPEQARALNALDEAMFLFNAAIARHE